MKNVLKENIIGRYVAPTEQVFKEIHVIVEENSFHVGKLNGGVKSDKEKRELIAKIIGEELEESTDIILPFYTDFGKHIKIGKNVFINMGVMFTDLGGITLEDKVLIGPGVKLVTVNHSKEPEKRRGIEVKPILIKENAWIGAGATILSGVTIGKNSIIAAGAVVNKDVPDNVIVGGIPAKIIKNI